MMEAEAELGVEEGEGEDYHLETLLGMRTEEESVAGSGAVGSAVGCGESAVSGRTASQRSSALDELGEEQRAEVFREVDDPLEFAIGCNEVYADQLTAFTDRVAEALRNTRAEMRRREVAMDTAEAGSGASRKRSYKVPSLLYIQPYFKDSSGTAAAQNADCLAKSRTTEFDALAQPRKKWTKAETEKLAAAVRADILRISTLSNRQRLEILQDKAKQAVQNLDMIAKEEYDEEIKEIKTKMKIDESKVETLVKNFKSCDKVDWLAISKVQFNGSRRPEECQRKWEGELSPRWTQTEWSQAEQERLQELVAANASINAADWDGIAEALGTARSAWAVFEEYQSKLNQLLLCGPWSEEEDERLRLVVEQLRYGEVVPWDQVAYAMEGRTRAQVQARYVRTLDPKVKRGRWSEDEDFILLVAIHNIGPKDWSKVSSKVPHRTDTQCRERWMSFLTEGVEYGAWKAEEDDILREAVGVFGVGAWSRASKLLPGRTPGMCKMRWHRMNKLRELMTDAIAQSKARNEPLVSLEELETSFVEPHVQGLEERKKKILERKERIKMRCEQHFGFSYESMMERFCSMDGQAMEEELEENINALPAKLRPTIRAKLTKLRWRHRDSHDSDRLRKPGRREGAELRSRAILGLPESSRDTAALAATLPDPPPKKAKKEQASPRAPSQAEREAEERRGLLQQLRKAVAVIDAYSARKAKKAAEEEAFHRHKSLYSEALKAGRLLPPSHGSLTAYLALKSAEPELRASGAQLPAARKAQLPASSALARLGPTAAGKIQASPGYAQLNTVLRSLTTFPRLLSNLSPPGATALTAQSPPQSPEEGGQEADVSVD